MSCLAVVSMMCVCVCVCACNYRSIQICTDLFGYIWVCTYMCTLNIHIHIYIYMYVFINVYVYAHVYLCVYTCIYLCVYIHTHYVCVQAYIHTHAFTSTHACIHWYACTFATHRHLKQSTLMHDILPTYLWVRNTLTNSYVPPSGIARYSTWRITHILLRTWGIS